MSLSEVLVSMTISLAAVAGFSSAASQYRAVEEILKVKNKNFSELRQEVERRKAVLAREGSHSDCQLVHTTRSCEIFSCIIADQENKLCIP